MYIFGIHDLQYLYLDHVSDFMFRSSHPIKFSHDLIDEVTAPLVDWSRQLITTRLCPTP